MTRFGYPILLGVYTLGALLLFVWTLRFITLNINKALDIETSQSGIVLLDTAAADYASRHLGVSQLPFVDNTIVPQASTEPAPPTATETVTAPSPAAVSVRVLNSTATAGLALDLAKKVTGQQDSPLVSAGNSSTVLPVTEIRLKEGAEGLRAQLETLVKTDYAVGPAVTLPASSAQDVVIVIGSQKP